MTTGGAAALAAAFERARPVADAVLREGQVLFPYRASALKNRHRWQWGCLAPPAWHATSGSDSPGAHVELVIDARAGARLHARARFVQLQARSPQLPGDRPGTWRDVPELCTDDAVVACWDEAVEHEVDLLDVALEPGGRTQRHAHPFSIDGGTTVDRVPGTDGRLHRRRQPLQGLLIVDTQPEPGPWSLVRVRLRVENTSGWCDPAADRAAALRHSLVATHLVVCVQGAAFVPPLDPPAFAAAAVAACRHEGLWPALVGDPGERTAVLAAPIVLPDHPGIAPDSAGDTCDATEIDELLARCVAGLTDDERREARGTDTVAASVLERFGAATPDVLARLHAVVRTLEDRPPATVVVGGAVVQAGSRVRLQPTAGTDAQDAFVAGRVAIVEHVVHDADGRIHLAVSLEDDPGGDVHRVRGWFRYYRPEEVEPLDPPR
jgi:hypothetical protein